MKTRQLLPIISILFISSCGFFKSADDLLSEAERKRNNGESKAALELLSKIVEKHADIKKRPRLNTLLLKYIIVICGIIQKQLMNMIN